MKSAYELAMERLRKQTPTRKLTETQKKELAELDSIYAAKIAQREIGLREAILKEESNGKDEEAAKLREQLQLEKVKLQSELEEKKETVRRG